MDVREARERWRIADGARAISFRSHDPPVILMARIYNEASFAPRLAALRAKVKRPFARSASWRSVNWPGFTIEQYSIITIMALLSLWLFYRFRCDVFTVVINPLLEIYAVIPRVSFLDVSQKQSPSANFAYCRKFVSQKRYIVIILTSLSIERCEASNLHILSNLLAVLIFKLTIIYQFYNDFFH